MKSVRSKSMMKSTIDWVSSAWVTFLATSLPCPATVGAYAVWPSFSSRSITGCHREPSWQPPCTSTKVYEFTVGDCESTTLTTVSFTPRYDQVALPCLETSGQVRSVQHSGERHRLGVNLAAQTREPLLLPLGLFWGLMFSSAAPATPKSQCR